MSQENVEVVKVAYEVFASEELDRFMEHFTDDVEYRVLAGGGSLELGPLQGEDAVRAWLQDWIDMFDDFWMELLELIDADGVTVFTTEQSTALPAGLEVASSQTSSTGMIMAARST